MKYAIILLLILFAGCKKDLPSEQADEPTTIAKLYTFGSAGVDTSTRLMKGQPEYQRYFTTHYYGNNNTTFLQATRARIEAKGLGGNSLQGVFHANYIRDKTGRMYWVQLGAHQWGKLGYFAMIFTFDGQPAPNGVMLQPPMGDLNIGQYYTYHIAIRENGNLYIGVDGVDFAYFPLNADYMTGTANYFESVGTTNRPQTMPTINFQPALEYLDAGQWKMVPWCRAGGFGYGVKALAPNHVIMGSQVKEQPTGQILWQ